MHEALRRTSARKRKKIVRDRIIRVGPKDNGRPMSWQDFEFAKTQEGYRYELERGRIVVSDIPLPRHLLQL